MEDCVIVSALFAYFHRGVELVVFCKVLLFHSRYLPSVLGKGRSARKQKIRVPVRYFLGQNTVSKNDGLWALPFPKRYHLSAGRWMAAW